MIDREQVLHVAKLARLRLSDDEVERMTGELSPILEHVEQMEALDLDGVEPTSHVVALENVLRDDVPGTACRASAPWRAHPKRPPTASACPARVRRDRGPARYQRRRPGRG